MTWKRFKDALSWMVKLKMCANIYRKNCFDKWSHFRHLDLKCGLFEDIFIVHGPKT